jgi:hypothetical protein
MLHMRQRRHHPAPRAAALLDRRAPPARAPARPRARPPAHPPARAPTRPPAPQTDLTRLSTKSGYIIGIMKKLRQRNPGLQAGGRGQPPPPPGGKGDPLLDMPPEVGGGGLAGWVGLDGPGWGAGRTCVRSWLELCCAALAPALLPLAGASAAQCRAATSPAAHLSPPSHPHLPRPSPATTTQVANRLESLMLLFNFSRADLDARVVEAFVNLPPPVSLHACDILGKRDFSSVRNMGGFLMSAIKQVGAGTSRWGPGDWCRRGRGAVWVDGAGGAEGLVVVRAGNERHQAGGGSGRGAWCRRGRGAVVRAGTSRWGPAGGGLGAGGAEGRW